MKKKVVKKARKTSVKKKEITICVNCKSFHIERGFNDHIWYHHFCHAPEVQVPDHTNPVTGRTEKTRIYARDINKGNCKHFDLIKKPTDGQIIDEMLDNFFRVEK